MTRPSGLGSEDRVASAVALRLLSALAFSLMGAALKLAEAGGASLIDGLFFRQLFALPVVVAAVAATTGLRSVRTQRLGAHLTRTVIGTSSMACMFATVLLLPLAEATTLQFTVPIFATILGAMLLKESVGWRRWAAVLLGFTGVLIVTRPLGGGIPALGIATGLTAAALSATVSILLRRMSRTEAPTTIVFWFCLLPLPLLAPLFVLGFAPHSDITWSWLVLVGLLGGVGQLAMTASLSRAPVSVVVPIDYSSMIWATLLGWALFGLLPATGTWIGGPLIVASGLWIVWREAARRRGTTVSASPAD